MYSVNLVTSTLDPASGRGVVVSPFVLERFRIIGFDLNKDQAHECNLGLRVTRHVELPSRVRVAPHSEM